MITRLLFVLIFAGLCFGCEKTEENGVDTITLSVKKHFIAGQFIGDSLVSKCFIPVKEVKGSRKGDDLNYTYLDSVLFDVNSDGINDIKFRYFEELVTYNCPPPSNPDVVGDCFPVFSKIGAIELLSNVEIAYNVIDYPIRVTQAQKFVQGDTISNHTLWTKEKIQMIGNVQSTTPFNSWSIDDYLSFVGIRMINRSDTLYGWIRVNTAYNSKFLISDYAVRVK